MRILAKLFGKWEVVSRIAGTAGYISPLLGREWSETVVFTIERHTRTQKERAFVHRPDGTKQATSLLIVQGLLPKVAP